MKNLEIYDAVRKCPENALKPISAGRLKGKSDINPMWRIKMLTELFGAAGVGWYYDIAQQWTEEGANGEVSAFCNINLYIKVDGEWSKPIQGTGGSSFIAAEKNGMYTSDECFKMALTDAISVACKALGFAADVYWDRDRSKYSARVETPQEQPIICPKCGKQVEGYTGRSGKYYSAEEVYTRYGKCLRCLKAEASEAKAMNDSALAAGIAAGALND